MKAAASAAFIPASSSNRQVATHREFAPSYQAMSRLEAQANQLLPINQWHRGGESLTP